MEWLILAAIACMALVAWAIDRRVRAVIRMLLVLAEAMTRIEERLDR